MKKILASISVLFLFFFILYLGLSFKLSLEKNKENVIMFYTKAFNNKDYAGARQYLGDDFKQHSPATMDGVEGIALFISFLKEFYPDSHREIKQAFVDGDYVILHVQVSGQEKAVVKSVVDIFRLDKNHKIVEHWDVMQVQTDISLNGNKIF